MSFIPLESRRDNGAREYGLTECDAADSRCVKAAKWVKRIALDGRAFNRLIHEAEIEVGVVPDEYRATTALFAYRSANFPEDALQSVAFVDRRSQWVMGVYAVNSQ